MNTRVSPTRMHLLELKKRHAVAVRGHKLLKDKLDELMKQFLELVKRDRELREEVDESSASFQSFLIAQGAMSQLRGCSVDVLKARCLKSFRHIMNVEVPKFEWSFEGQEDRTNIYPYGFAYTSSELDSHQASFRGHAGPRGLAEVEKSVELLAGEIERTRRRIANTLLYPSLKPRSSISP